MSSSEPVEVEHTTAMAVEEKAKLQKHFSRFDIFFFLICTLVGLDTLALDAETINNTLGALLKYQDDIARVQGTEAARILSEVRAEIATA